MEATIGELIGAGEPVQHSRGHRFVGIGPADRQARIASAGMCAYHRIGGVLSVAARRQGASSGNGIRECCVKSV